MKTRVGPSFEEAAFSIRGEGARAPALFAIHVDEQFTKDNQEKLQALKELNPKTNFDKVNVSKIDATLENARKYAPKFNDLWFFYDDLLKIKKDIFLYFPYKIQKDNGTYLIHNETGLNAFLKIMEKVEYLFEIFGSKKLVLDKYFDTNGWKVDKINVAFRHYRQQVLRQAQKKKRRIEPTPNPRKRSKSPSPRKSPTKRKRSSPRQRVPARRPAATRA